MSFSLEKNIRTCKVNTGWAPRNQSDRFQDPSLMVCPTWNHMDNAGRHVCANSFYTKRAGCNSALDRVVVEDNLRPQYMEYVQLNALGIAGQHTTEPFGVPMSNGQQNCNTAAVNSQVRTDTFKEDYQQTGAWNNNIYSTTTANCPTRAYAQAMGELAGQARQNSMAQADMATTTNLINAGM